MPALPELLPRPARPPRAARVLVVDDDRPAGERVGAALTGFGLQVVGVTTSGDLALALARCLEPDLVVTDLRMPSMDGVELTRLLTALPLPPAVLVLSDPLDQGRHAEALAAGSAGCLVKTGPADALRAAVVAATGPR